MFLIGFKRCITTSSILKNSKFSSSNKFIFMNQQKRSISSFTPKLLTQEKKIESNINNSGNANTNNTNQLTLEQINKELIILKEQQSKQLEKINAFDSHNKSLSIFLRGVSESLRNSIDVSRWSWTIYLSLTTLVLAERLMEQTIHLTGSQVFSTSVGCAVVGLFAIGISRSFHWWILGLAAAPLYVFIKQKNEREAEEREEFIEAQKMAQKLNEKEGESTQMLKKLETTTTTMSERKDDSKGKVQDLKNTKQK